MKIPVFHDDQHGTAIIVGGAVLNGLRVVETAMGRAKLVCSGAGAAALACLDLLVSLGLKPENIWVSDLKGVVYQGRKEEMDPNKARYTRKTSARTLAEIMPGADVFLGLSAGGVLKAEMVAQMADKPLILALANPEPEILPDVAKNVRPDAVIATDRKSTRLNSSHTVSSYAVFCLKKKTLETILPVPKPPRLPLNAVPMTGPACFSTTAAVILQPNLSPVLAQAILGMAICATHCGL